MVALLTTHGGLDAPEPVSGTVGGRPATVVEVLAIAATSSLFWLAPDGTPQTDDPESHWPGVRPVTYFLDEGDQARFSMLDVDVDLVVFTVMGHPGADLDAAVEVARSILGSVTWGDREAPAASTAN